MTKETKKDEPVFDVFGNKEKETFIKITGNKFSFKAINVVKENGWIMFDRVNTKTGEVSGRLEFPMSMVEGIETR